MKKASSKDTNVISAKNNRSHLLTNSQPISSKPGRKRQESIEDIIYCHKEFLKALLCLYEKGTMGEEFTTGMARLARYISEKKILMRQVNGKVISLRKSTITVELSNVWKELKEDREKELNTRVNEYIN